MTIAWSRHRTLLAGLVAAALVSSAVGPCLCLLSDHACHGAAEAAKAHSCCENPTGVQAVADECCEGTSGIVMTTTEVPEVAPPVLRSDLLAPLSSSGEHEAAGPVRLPPPLPLDRTTVLLI